jgi:hypothetical protein
VFENVSLSPIRFTVEGLRFTRFHFIVVQDQTPLYFYDVQIKEGGIGDICNTNGRDEK